MWFCRLSGKPHSRKDYLLFPLSFVLLAVPLAIRLMEIPLDSGTAELYGNQTRTDLYARSKLCLLLFGGILVLVFAAVFMKKLLAQSRRVSPPVLAAALLFLVMALASALAASNRTVAFWGLFSQAEGFFTQLCYILLFFYAALAYQETGEFCWVSLPLLLVASVNLVLGVMQFIGIDWLDIPLLHALIIPSGSSDSPISYGYGGGKMYGTLSHYNYLGSLSILLLPFFLSRAASAGKGSRVLFLSAALASGLLLFGSTSRAGLIGLAAVLLLGALLLGRLLLSHWKAGLASLAGVVFLLAGGNLLTEGKLLERVPSLAGDIQTLFSPEGEGGSGFPLVDITHREGAARLCLRNGFLELSFEEGAFFLRDGEGDILASGREKAAWTLEDTALAGYAFQLGSSGRSPGRTDLAVLTQDGLPLFFFHGDTAGAHLVSPYTLREIELDRPATWGFEGKERVGSMRGYIWSRSLPLVPGRLLIGFGPDQFVFHFPQNDFIGKYNAYGTTNMLITRPHNLYLQIFLNNGGIAFAAWLLLLGIYVFQSLRLYALKRNYTSAQIRGIGIFLSVCGYLAAGLFNDSMLSVSPVFWIMLGIGFAVNHSVRLSAAASGQKMDQA